MLNTILVYDFGNVSGYDFGYDFGYDSDYDFDFDPHYGVDYDFDYDFNYYIYTIIKYIKINQFFIVMIMHKYNKME
jgi:hypothetical protein